MSGEMKVGFVGGLYEELTPSFKKLLREVIPAWDGEKRDIYGRGASVLLEQCAGRGISAVVTLYDPTVPPGTLFRRDGAWFRVKEVVVERVNVKHPDQLELGEQAQSATPRANLHVDDQSPERLLVSDGIAHVAKSTAPILGEQSLLKRAFERGISDFGDQKPNNDDDQPPVTTS